MAKNPSPEGVFKEGETIFRGTSFFSNGGHLPPPTFAASRQRRDLIIAHPWVGFPKGRGRAPSPFGRFKVRGFLRGEGNRNPSPLERRFASFADAGKGGRSAERNLPGGSYPPPTLCGFLPGIAQKNTYFGNYGESLSKIGGAQTADSLENVVLRRTVVQINKNSG